MRSISFLMFSYLLAEMIAPFLATLAILTGVMFLGRLMQLFEIILSLRINGPDFLRLSLYILPKLMMFSLPLASMLAVMLSFGRLQADNEILALRSAGVSTAQILLPVLFFALTISCLAGYSSMVLMPKGLVNLKSLMLQLARENIDRGVRGQLFSDSIGGIVVYVEQVDPSTGQWRNVYLYDGRQKGRPVIITAQEGRVETDYENIALTFSLKNGEVDYLDETLARNVLFRELDISIPVSLPGLGNTDPKKRIEMSQQQLLEASEKNGPNSPGSIKFMIEYHQRLILAAGCFILTLLGFPLAARSKPGMRRTAVPVGLFFFLLYYLLFNFAETVAEQGKLGVGLVLWTPNLLFTLLTLVAINQMGRIERANPVKLFFTSVERVRQLFRQGLGK